MGNTSENNNKKHICLGLVAHVDAGKTTLSEGMLYLSGGIRSMGRVDHGDAFLDTYELERERGITIFSKQAVLSWKDMDITILDTPGHVDFSAEMERVLQVLDYAVLIISGADGVQGHTMTLWKLLERYKVPVFLFINKMDRGGVDREALLTELKDRLSENCADFTGLPAAGNGESVGEERLEAVAVCDEELLESYLETGGLDTDLLGKAVAERRIFPCWFGSALKAEGIGEFLDGIREYAVSPAYPEIFGAKDYKIARDTQGNRLTYLKVTGGELKVKETLPDVEGKVNQIRLYSGDKYELLQAARAGIGTPGAGTGADVPGGTAGGL